MPDDPLPPFDRPTPPANDDMWGERLRAEALGLWPLSLGALVVYIAFIGPMILGMAGISGGASFVERVLAFGAAQRWVVVVLGLLLLALGLLVVHAEPVQRGIQRGGMGVYLLAKFALVIPFFVVLVLLLQTVLVPINNALSGR